MKIVVLWTLAVATAALAFGVGSASGYLFADRTWWEHMNDATQVRVVEGGVLAFEAGWAEGVYYGVGRMKGNTNRALAIANSGLPKFSHIYPFYAAQITDFYARHNDSSLDFGSLLDCIRDNAPASCDTLNKAERPQKR